MKKLIVLMMTVALAGCGGSSIFDGRYVPDRPNFGKEPIPVPPPGPPLEIVNPDPVPGMAPEVVERITGTWTFVTPPTVTRVERKTAEFSQFSLYNGRPAPGDTPFVVITVSPTAQAMAEADTESFRVANSRVYALNGNVAKEWTGNTKTGRGFCELLIRKPGDAPGDLCHALATVRSAEEQTMALEILASIRWTPNVVPGPATQPGEP